MEDRPIVFTITYINDSELRVYTKDPRWEQTDFLMDFRRVPLSNLYACIDAITTIGNGKGYAIIFEVD